MITRVKLRPDMGQRNMDRRPPQSTELLDQRTTSGADRIGDRELRPELLTPDQHEAAMQAEAQQNERLEALADLDHDMMRDFQSSLTDIEDRLPRSAIETTSARTSQNTSRSPAQKTKLHPVRHALMSIWSALRGGS